MSTEIMSQPHQHPIDNPSMIPNDDDVIAQLDALDDQSLRDPRAYFQLVALMEPRLHAIQSINQLKESVASDILSKDHNASVDLNQSIGQSMMVESVAKERTKVLEQLSRSKMNFLHVQTKRLLIESLLPFDAPAPEKSDLEVRLAEQKISDAKANLDAFKRQLDELIKEIKTKAKQFTTDYDQLINRSNAFQDEFDPDQFVLLSQQMQDCGLDPNLPSNHDDDVMDRLLEAEKVTIDELEAQIKALDDQIDSQTNSIANDQSTIEQLEKHLADNPPMSQEVSTAELEWYQGLTNVLSQWNGIEIISAQSERSLKIQISPLHQSSSTQPADLVIEVDVNPHNVLQFNGGVVTSGHISDTTWDRLLDEALDTQDLPGLLRSLQTALVDEQKEESQAMEL